jgi:hypothetical protein
MISRTFSAVLLDFGFPRIEFSLEALPELELLNAVRGRIHIEVVQYTWEVVGRHLRVDRRAITQVKVDAAVQIDRDAVLVAGAMS